MTRLCPQECLGIGNIHLSVKLVQGAIYFSFLEDRMMTLITCLKVWSAALMKEERYLVTGSMDMELRVWKLNWTDDVKDGDKLVRQMEIVKLEETENIEENSVCTILIT